MVKMVSFMSCGFYNFFLNLGFKHQDLKEENLEDNVIIHGSNLRRLKIQTLPERTGKDREARNWVSPCSWRLLYVLLTGRHPVKKKKKNRRFVNIMGEKILKEEGWVKGSQMLEAAGALCSKLGQELSWGHWNNKRQRTQQCSEKVFHCDISILI